MHPGLRLLCKVLTAIGVLMLTVSAAQAAGLGEFFETPPWITGIALTTIGGLMLVGGRVNRGADAKSQPE